MRVSEFKEYVKNKKNQEHLNRDLPKTIRLLKDRIDSLKATLAMTAGWHNKELLRKSIELNEKMLADANSEFLRRAL